MTPQDFIRKWKTHALTERAAAQEHFIDLCRLFGHPTPAEDDPAGDHFTFEKGAAIAGGGDGWADVWKKGYFAWEYKKRRRNLDEATVQLTRYAAALEHPPLLVVCDTIRFQILTTWTNLETKKYSFELEDLADPEKFNLLRAVFHNPDALKPTRTRAMITAEAAKKFQSISDALQQRNPDREAVAHFVNQLVFCFFADSVKLLPEGLLKKLLQTCEKRPHKSRDYFQKLFDSMKDGGDLDLTEIAHFNGGLFDGKPALGLEHVEIQLLFSATSLDWSLIDPTIFGTLFERFLDPDKRAQIGAHYTDPEKIMMIVEPVVLRPLRAQWAEAFIEIEKIMKPLREAAPAGRAGQSAHDKKIAAARAKAETLRDDFIDGLTRLRILDPACGSGNFLYLALQGVKDIEYRAINDCETLGLGRPATRVGPEILHGIEINPFAAELARTTIWIGDIQWSIKNAIYSRPQPILRKLDSIERRDAILNDDGGEAQWPETDFIVGNPPFLGGKLLRKGLGDEYVAALFAAYDGSVPAEADLVCYWFAKAWAAIVAGRAKRAGLVSTNSIRGGANRRVLVPIAEQGTIFEAWSDEPWILDGAAVRVSIVCFSFPSPLAGEGGPAPAGPDEGAPGAGRALRGMRGETLRTHAREMRKAPTDAEKILWHILRDRRFSGYKFRRQAPIGNYIADFVCPSERLIVEADGSQHAESPRDAARDAWFASQGFRVRRFWNAEILQKREMVADTLWADLAAPSSVSPSASHLLPQGEKGEAAPVFPSPLAGEGGPAPVGPDEGAPREQKRLDGFPVETINADLSARGFDITQARRLAENEGVAFMGDTKGGAFDIPGELARSWLQAPLNPNGRPNSDVLRPWVNGLDVTRRPRDMWIIDFGVEMTEQEAALYEEPFAYVLEHVKPERDNNRRDAYRKNWWRHVEARPAMWAAIEALGASPLPLAGEGGATKSRRVRANVQDPRHEPSSDTASRGHLLPQAGEGARYIVTPRVAKHRLFSWLAETVEPDIRCHRHRPRRRHQLRRPSLALSRSLVAAALHLARRRQRSPLHPDHHLRNLPLPRRPHAQHSRQRLCWRPSREAHRAGREEARRAAPRMAQPAGPRGDRSRGRPRLPRPHPPQKRRGRRETKSPHADQSL